MEVQLALLKNVILDIVQYQLRVAFMITCLILLL